MISPAERDAMQALVSARWRERGPYVDHHAGDVAWGTSGPGGDGVTALLLDGAYAFRSGDAWVVVGPRYDEALDAALEAGAYVYALTAETDKAAALAARGYVPGPARSWHLVRDLAGLPPVAGPFTDMTDGDPDERAALHRAAWAPSRLTRETYDAVRATPPYRPDLDVVARTPEGEAAAYALAWYDAGSASGELEPVGTAPARRRRGYARTACLAALHRLRDAGARTAVVYAVTDPANQGPRALYESLGFAVVDRHVRWTPPSRQNAPEGGTT